MAELRSMNHGAGTDRLSDSQTFDGSSTFNSDDVSVIGDDDQVCSSPPSLYLSHVLFTLRLEQVVINGVKGGKTAGARSRRSLSSTTHRDTDTHAAARASSRRSMEVRRLCECLCLAVVACCCCSTCTFFTLFPFLICCSVCLVPSVVQLFFFSGLTIV